LSKARVDCEYATSARMRRYHRAVSHIAEERSLFCQEKSVWLARLSTV